MPGYDIDMVNTEMFNEFFCNVCHLLLKDAIQLVHGERICLSCYDENKHKTTDHDCMDYSKGVNGGPRCTIPEKGYFQDRFARRAVSEIEVYCSFKSNGCGWVGPVKDFEEHVDYCDKRPTSCTKCNQRTEDCPGSISKLEYCAEDLQAHIRERNPQHLTYDECNRMLQPEQATNPPGTFGLLHWPSTIFIFGFFDLLSNIQAKLCGMYDLRMFKQIVDDIQSKVIRWTDYLEEQLQSQAIVVEDTKNMATKCESALRDIIADKEKCHSQLMDIESKTFTNELQIQEQLTAFGDMQKQFNVLTDKIEALKAAVYEIRKSQQRILGQGATPTLQIPVHPPLDSSDYIVTYNGEMTWKISGVTQKRQEAILNKTRSFYSPPFFTSPSGYMCCGRIYMNGDGSAEGTHISLFFVVMKGPYDALQQWPFSNKITLALLNQDGGSHHEESLMPDLSSSSFERPKKETNIASGSPFFYSFNALESCGFLKEDTIFVRIKVNV